MQCETLVLGAGIVGVCSALHLQALGREVVLVDRAAPGSGTSYGNAGLIERSSIVPYAFPRDLRRLMLYALNQQPDVRYDWRYLPQVAPWLWKYWQASSKRNLQRAAEAMLPLVQRCVEEHCALAAASGQQGLLRDTGWIEIYRSHKAFARAQADAAQLHVHHLRYSLLDAGQLQAVEPSLGQGAAGAVHWHDPMTVQDPGALALGYTALFMQRGGRFMDADALTLRQQGNHWQLETAAGTLHAREVVVALGPESNRLLSPLGYRIPLQSKRGYHMHYQTSAGATLNHPVCDPLGGFVLAPMNQGLRLTTGIEFAAEDAPANDIQLLRCEALARRFYPLGERLDVKPWLGRRPCLPDMRPVIGPAGRHPGLWFNFGHAHHGLTLGPVCGRLLAQMMAGAATFTNPAPYSPARFS
ncbi:NAD(P)/FAD-dependent oxidoreductase [Pseudomonas sp. CFBP 13710]|uniref:NAD(P)/FAD-dependent oxidoreductase n=1 Tax=Pseudomonas sp. CFBP 13710 TaxID=2775311 RepID=UPI001785CF29|nr:FAD-binding oxidoreductase [Pseudomonas sp. CFBP 13710]MBD8731493.1 FAD-binding oxidoreductase [Pseudomonas sp. CFBP 13710]